MLTDTVHIKALSSLSSHFHLAVVMCLLLACCCHREWKLLWRRSNNILTIILTKKVLVRFSKCFYFFLQVTSTSCLRFNCLNLSVRSRLKINFVFLEPFENGENQSLKSIFPTTHVDRVSMLMVPVVAVTTQPDVGAESVPYFTTEIVLRSDVVIFTARGPHRAFSRVAFILKGAIFLLAHRLVLLSSLEVMLVD